MKHLLAWLNPFKAGGLRWTHLHVGLTFVLLAYVAGVGSGVGAVFTTQHFARVGGARPVRETHIFHASGVPLPLSHSLAQFAFRTHWQHQSSSCVGQTVATMAEIETYEFRHVKIPMASEFSWTQCQGGIDQGVTYNCAFDVFTREGQARISSLYPYDDGSTPWAYPSQAAIASAWPFRQTSWRFISPSDQYTVEYEIAHGRPVALLFAVYDNFYNGTTTAGRYISYDGGHYWFNHSVTIIAYDRYGVEVQNSWGSRWGNNARMWLTWAYIARFGLNLVAANPYEPPKPEPKPAPLHWGGPTPKPRPWYVAGIHLYNNAHKRNLSPLLNASGDRWHISPVMLAATLETESGANPYAERWGYGIDKSCGLTQEIFEVVRQYGVNGTDRQVCTWEEKPEHAISLGARILSSDARIARLIPPRLYVAFNAGPYRPHSFYAHPTGDAAINYSHFLGWYSWVIRLHIYHQKPAPRPAPIHTGGFSTFGVSGGSPP